MGSVNCPPLVSRGARVIGVEQREPEYGFVLCSSCCSTPGSAPIAVIAAALRARLGIGSTKATRRCLGCVSRSVCCRWQLTVVQPEGFKLSSSFSKAFLHSSLAGDLREVCTGEEAGATLCALGLAKPALVIAREGLFKGGDEEFAPRKLGRWGDAELELWEFVRSQVFAKDSMAEREGNMATLVSSSLHLGRSHFCTRGSSEFTS